MCHRCPDEVCRIGLITGPSNTTTGRERRLGYQHALQAAGIAHDPSIDLSGCSSQDMGRQRAFDLLGVAPPIEALVVADHRLAMGALQALHARGRRSPADLALVGFDDLPGEMPGSPSLTTVVQPAFELGSAAALRLVQRLQSAGPLVRQETLLAHTLRIGDSSRPRPVVRRPSEERALSADPQPGPGAPHRAAEKKAQ